MEGDQERWSGKPLCISTNIIMAHPAPHLHSSSPPGKPATTASLTPNSTDRQKADLKPQD